AGGYPIELPASAIAGETYTKPTAMLYRNLLAMEVEELIRSYPVDGVVLLGGCDKTTPALLMGAISAGLPAIFVPAGPMLRGNWRGEAPGADPHQRGVRGRGHHGGGAVRFHQRGHPSHRDGAPQRGTAESRRLRRGGPQHSGTGERRADGRLPDGGLLLRGRAARAARPARRPAAPGPADGGRTDVAAGDRG